MSVYEIRRGVNGKRVVWPSGAVVSVRSPRMSAATLTMLSAADDCPEPAHGLDEFVEFQRTVMDPLRAELRAAADEALTAVLAAGDPQ